MVQIQLEPREPLTTVLTPIVVTRVDVVPAEPNVSLRHAVVRDEKNDARDPHDPTHHADRIMVDTDRELAPAGEIEGPVLFVDRPCNVLVEQDEGTTNGGHMHGEVRAIEYQYLRIEHRHRSSPSRAKLIRAAKTCQESSSLMTHTCGPSSPVLYSRASMLEVPRRRLHGVRNRG